MNRYEYDRRVEEVKRRYSSPLRAQAAQRTRQAVLDSAARLFVECGYRASSLSEIARVAGVARPTAFAAFGSKVELLRHVVDRALAGDDEPVPVAERPWFRPVWAATSQYGVLSAYAEVCRLIAGRVATLFEVVRAAADESPETAALWQRLRANRRAGATMVTDRLAALGPLRDGLDTAAVVDVLWIFNDPSLYASLVLERGWAEADYARWLAEQMCAGALPREAGAAGELEAGPPGT